MVRMTLAGEMLVLVQVASLASSDEQQQLVTLLVETLTGKEGNVTSIYLQINDSPTDAARPDAILLHIFGKPRLEMPLLGLKFEIGPASFFQANTATCISLFETALQFLCPEGSVVFDVCCGVGTIGLCAAKRCKRVIGLELVAEAIEAAKHNAALNGINNASFHAGKAEDLLPKLLRELEGDEDICAVVDPPRAGLHKSALEALRSCERLSRLVYVSCNPESLVEDVLRLTVPRDVESIDHFVPVRAVAVDMFPHTLHCEMVLLLERASRVSDPRLPAQTSPNAAERKACSEAT